MDLRDTDWDPMAALLELIAKYEALEQQQNRIVEHMNNQASIIHQQSRIIEDMFHRLQKLEEEII